MPFWKRKAPRKAAVQQDSQPLSEMLHDVPTFTVPEPTAPCTLQGCENLSGIPCSYVDRRGSRCDTPWCADHLIVVGRHIYCRRHANTILALGDAAKDPLALPHVNDRGPSLVNWIAKELDPTMRTVLEKIARPDETMSQQKSVMVTYDERRRRRWERNWKLIAHTGVNVNATLRIEEASDALIYIVVNGRVVARGIPPWIERRRRAADIEPEIDATERLLFYGFIEENFVAAIAKLRPTALDVLNDLKRAHAKDPE